MEVPFIIALCTIILTIILKIIDNNLDTITKNNLKMIELSNEIVRISEQLKEHTYNNSADDKILEEIEDIYGAIKSINNEIMHIKNKIF
jgi:hypothetical protein